MDQRRWRGDQRPKLRDDPAYDRWCTRDVLCCGPFRSCRSVRLLPYLRYDVNCHRRYGRVRQAPGGIWGSRNRLEGQWPVECGEQLCYIRRGRRFDLDGEPARATLSSVAGRTTTLENAVNSTTNGLSTKASASAVDALTNRVSAAEGVNTSQSSSITELNNNVGAILGVLGASGLDPAPNCLWQFDSAAEGWVAAGATLAQGAGFVKITATGADPQLLSGTVATLSIAGSIYTRVRVRITRRAGAATDWDGQLFYSTAGHGFAASYRAVAANPNLAVGQSAVVEWDMANLAAGAPIGWITLSPGCAWILVAAMAVCLTLTGLRSGVSLLQRRAGRLSR